MKEEMSSIILLGTENPVALHVIRGLKAAFPVTPIHALSRRNGKTQSAMHSRYLRSHQYIRAGAPDELRQEIERTVQDTGATILLPVDEHFVSLLSRLTKTLENSFFLPPLPDLVMFDRLIHKRRLHELLIKYGLPSARTYPLNPDIVSDISNDFFPCLLKPVRGSSGWGIVKIYNQDMLYEHIGRLNGEEYILQEFIPGQDMGCSILSIDGNIKAMTIQRCLVKKEFSISTVIHFEHRRDVSALIHDLIGRTAYSGLAHLDLRIDQRDGSIILNDFNGRFWSSILGSTVAGVDFIKLYCLAAMGIDFEVPEYRETTYLMGRSVLSHYIQKFIDPLSNHTATTSTDVSNRICDPFPELIGQLNER